jgi:hypothetical protein
VLELVAELEELEELDDEELDELDDEELGR